MESIRQTLNMNGRGLLLLTVQVFLLAAFFVAPKGYGPPLGGGFTAFALTITGFALIGAALVRPGKSKVYHAARPVGIYKWIRQPAYSGLLFIITGIALYTASTPKMIIAFLLFVFFRIKSSYEESLVLDESENYREYLRNTGRFLPKIRRKKAGY